MIIVFFRRLIMCWFINLKLYIIILPKYICIYIYIVQKLFLIGGYTVIVFYEKSLLLDYFNAF